MNQIKDNKVIMKIKNLISVILLSGGIMGTGLYSSDNHQKIRSRFNIQESYCAIKTNGVLERMYCEKMVIQPEPPVPALMP